MSGYSILELGDGLAITRPVIRSLTEILGEAPECECSPPFTITWIDATHIRVDFDRPVLVVGPLTWPGSYVFSPWLAVIAITPGPTSPAGDLESVEYVTVTTAEQGPENYTLTISGLEAA